jgi:hypothetical protein
MQATESTSTKAPQASAGDQTLRLCSPFIVDGTQPRPAGSHFRVASRVIARWLRRQLAESLRGWALAAGVHPDRYS